MKVLLINGSPNEFGCTYTALSETAKVLNSNGIETEIVYLGKKPISGCIACGVCRAKGECVWKDIVNDVAKRLDAVDGLIIGSPVHFASATGSMTAFLDRLFYSARRYLEKKPGACVVSCRRGGATATFDQLNKYFTISNMPVVSSQYWNQIHGHTAEEAKQDLEGMQTMRILGENMAWLLKCIEAGRQAGVPEPKYETKIYTNYIR